MCGNKKGWGDHMSHDATKEQIMQKATSLLAQVDTTLDMSDIDKLAVLKTAASSLESIISTRSLGAVIAANLKNIGM